MTSSTESSIGGVRHSGSAQGWYGKFDPGPPNHRHAGISGGNPTHSSVTVGSSPHGRRPIVVSFWSLQPPPILSTNAGRKSDLGLLNYDIRVWLGNRFGNSSYSERSHPDLNVSFLLYRVLCHWSIWTPLCAPIFLLSGSKLSRFPCLIFVQKLILVDHEAKPWRHRPNVPWQPERVVLRQVHEGDRSVRYGWYGRRKEGGRASRVGVASICFLMTWRLFSRYIVCF